MPKIIKPLKRLRQVRTIVLQATGEQRRMGSSEVGIGPDGKLHQATWKTGHEYAILRVVSDAMEPER